MKTPQEKAKELVDKYYHLFSVKLENTIADYEAIECVLIAIDEILEMIDEDSLYFDYWVEVKEEVLKL